MREMDKDPLQSSGATRPGGTSAAEGSIASSRLHGRLQGASHKSGVRVLKPKQRAEFGAGGRDGGLTELTDTQTADVQGPNVGIEPTAAGAGSVSPVVQNDVEPDAGADLIGLQRGDGLEPGTEPARPRVMELQRRLNASMLAELAVDGLFGPLTGRALREFQESLREPQQEFVDPVTAGALVGVAPPGFAPTGAGGPQPDQVQLEVAAMFANAAATNCSDLGKNFLLAGPLLGSQTLTQQHLFAAGTGLSVQSLPFNQFASELQAASKADQLASGAIGNPLVGVQRGDGLVFGTFDRRTRVRLLQSKLNERGGASLAVDGKFGPLTAKALTEFQSSVAMPQSERVGADTADLLMGQDPSGGSSPDDTVAQAVRDAGQSIVDAGGLLRGAGPELTTVAVALASGEDLAAAGAASEFFAAAGNMTLLSANLNAVGAALKSATAGPVGIEARAHVRRAAMFLATAAEMTTQWGRDLMHAGAGYVPSAMLDTGVVHGLTAAGVAGITASSSLSFASSQLETV